MACDIIERWKESSIASALSTALTIYPCQIRVHLNSNFLQLGRRSGGRPQRAVHPMRLPVNTVIHTGLEPATLRSLVGRLSGALPVVPPTRHQVMSSCQPLCHIRHWISWKLLEIDAWFQKTIKRKWPTGNRMVTWPMTLCDDLTLKLKGQSREANMLRAQHLKNS